jgi:anti-anti-sigma factor
MEAGSQDQRDAPAPLQGDKGGKPMDFEFETSPIADGNALLIAVKGELDLATVEQLKGPAELAISERRPVIFDLSECPFIDSTGLRLVLHLHNGLSNGDAPSAPIAVVANPHIRKLFSLTAIDLMVAVFATRDEALAALKVGRGTEPGRDEPASSSQRPTNRRVGLA